MIRVSRISSITGLFVILTASVALADPLPRSSPESQGVSSQEILSFVQAADQNIHAIHSFMLVRHGKVVAEGWWKPESAEKPHILNSLSKSFTSTAIGFAQAEGKLDIDDPVLKFFPDDAPANPSENLKAMRIRDLLSMTCGQEREVKLTKDDNWVKSFLAHPVPFQPGTHFLYNSPGVYMLSAIIQKVTGQTMVEYLRPRLFEPLGIENPNWATSPQGINTGGWGLFIRTEDIAKFGQLYLQHGMWNGKQLLPASWVTLATTEETYSRPSGFKYGTSQVKPDSDWFQGYGFLFWRCRHDAYRGDGANGQYCIVLPEQDAVLAITADTRDMQAEINVVWDKLLSAFHDKALPENSGEDANLKKALANLEVHPAGQKAAAQSKAENAVLTSKQ